MGPTLTGAVCKRRLAVWGLESGASGYSIPPRRAAILLAIYPVEMPPTKPLPLTPELAGRYSPSAAYRPDPDLAHIMRAT